MKKLATLFLLMCFCISLRAQTVVYLNLGSHSESGATDLDYSTTINYTNFYTLTKRLADSVNSKHAKWNFQNDYKFLKGCINHDPHAAATGGYNLVYWMNKSQYIEADPHCHEGLYNWADIAKLHDSLGCTNRKVVGGIDPYSYRWVQMETGINGNFFPTYNWQPDILWGFASPGHGFNDQTYGIWRPQDTANIYTDAPANHLRHIGSGCSNVVFAGSTVTGVMDTLRQILNKLQAGTAPSTGFYTATIMMNMRDFNTAFVTKIATIIDSIKPYVTAGKVKWATLQEKDSIWAATYASTAFEWDCSQTLATGINENADVSSVSIYPNPANDALTIKLDAAKNEKTIVSIYDMLGKELKNVEIGNSDQTIINTSDLKPGMYLCKILSGTNQQSRLLSIVH